MSSLAFFNQVLDDFEKAPKLHSCYYRMGGHVISLQFASENLLRLMTPSIEHLQIEPQDPELSIGLFENPNLPQKVRFPKLKRENLTFRGEIPEFTNEKIKIAFKGMTSCLQMIDLDRNFGLFWVPSYHFLHYWEVGDPLFDLLHWWFVERKKQVVHAAAIGLKDTGALIIGRGGSGKSSTSLSCLLSNRLKFIGDDHCLLEKGTIHGLYNSAKLKEDTLHRFPETASWIFPRHRSEVNKRFQILDKDIAIFHPHPQVVSQLPLKIVFIPRLSHEKKTKITPTSPGKMLTTLAPSTIFQLPYCGASSMQLLKEILENVTCYQLDLGTDREEIADAIYTTLNNEQ